MPVKGEREMIITSISAANRCTYCIVAHGALLRVFERKPLVADQVGRQPPDRRHPTPSAPCWTSRTRSMRPVTRSRTQTSPPSMSTASRTRTPGTSPPSRRSSASATGWRAPWAHAQPRVLPHGSPSAAALACRVALLLDVLGHGALRCVALEDPLWTRTDPCAWLACRRREEPRTEPLIVYPFRWTS